MDNVSAEVEQVNQEWHYRHHVAMKVVLKWVLTAAVAIAIFGIGVAVGIRVVGQTLQIVSTYRIDWGVAFNLGVFMIMVAIAAAIVIGAAKRKQAVG